MSHMRKRSPLPLYAAIIAIAMIFTQSCDKSDDPSYLFGWTDPGFGTPVTDQVPVWPRKPVSALKQITMNGLSGGNETCAAGVTCIAIHTFHYNGTALVTEAFAFKHINYSVKLSRIVGIPDWTMEVTQLSTGLTGTTTVLGSQTTVTSTPDASLTVQPVIYRLILSGTVTVPNLGTMTALDIRAAHY